MIKITIVAPNGYKMWFKISREILKDWATNMCEIALNESVEAATFDFQKEGEGTDISKT